MKTELSNSQVVESMISFVRKNLELGDVKETSKKNSPVVTFIGVNKDDTKVALEVVVNIEYSNQAISKSYFNKRIENRTKHRSKKNKTYTAVLFPKSIDYPRANHEFRCSYFKQANLLRTASKSMKLKYDRFRLTDTKELSRIEWDFILDKYGGKIAYYNPMTQIIDIHTFQCFPFQTLIPDNKKPDKGYFWDFMELGFLPREDNGTRKAKVFRGIQEGLHDRVRRMIKTEHLSGCFSLTSYKPGVARIYDRQIQLDLDLK